MSEQFYEEWLSLLKEGDQVAVSGSGNVPRLAHVQSRTRTRISLDNGSVFNAKTGWKISSDHWAHESINPVTPAVMARIAREKLEDAVWSELTKIRNINVLRKLSDERLTAILAALQEKEDQ